MICTEMNKETLENSLESVNAQNPATLTMILCNHPFYIVMIMQSQIS